MFRGTIDAVTTVLFYLVIAAVIGVVVFFLAILVFGRGEQMAPLDPRTSPAELPDHDIDSEDVRKIRFALALRGYRMSDVDWTLERLGEQIDALRLENAHLRDQVTLPAESAALPEQSGSADRASAAPADSLDGPAVALPAPNAAAPTRGTEAERWGPALRTRPAAQPAPDEEPTLPQEQLRERFAEREAAPAVDR